MFGLIANFSNVAFLFNYLNFMIKLIGAKLLLKVEDAEKKTSSGLVLPDTVSSNKARAAMVVAVGNGERNSDGVRVPIEISVGDKVLYNHSEYGVSEIEVEGVKHIIVEERDVIGIL